MNDIRILRLELKALLFWALVGFTDSNGGSYENKLPKIIAKYLKATKTKTTDLPSMGTQTTAKLSGRTFELVKKELKKVYPRTNL